MEAILARVHFKHKEGADITYLTDKTELYNFGLSKDTEFKNLTIIEKGTILTLKDRMYRVVAIHTTCYDTFYDNSDEYDINMYGIGNRPPYNFDITYILENA